MRLKRLACQTEENGYAVTMSGASEKVEIPVSVLASVETLDELEDWLMSHQPAIMEELREARRDDLAGKFRPWTPRYAAWPTESK